MNVPPPSDYNSGTAARATHARARPKRRAATPCPGSSGCRCPYCYGLAEYMLDLTGNDYGLPYTYQPWIAPPKPEQPQREPEPTARLKRPPAPIRQPWEPRPARKRAA